MKCGLKGPSMAGEPSAREVFTLNVGRELLEGSAQKREGSAEERRVEAEKPSQEATALV